jgi:paraquat-inducible protein A
VQTTDAIRVEYDAMSHRLNEDQAAREELAVQIKHLSQEVERLTRDERVQDNQFREIELRHAELQTNLGNISEQCQEKFSQEIEQLAEAIGEVDKDPQTLHVEVTEMREKLDRIGLVNMAALAALAAAIPMCIPAYDASIMINDQLTGVLEHTVLGTVQLLADRGYWHIGVIVLVAGVAIPITELVGLTWLLARVRFPNTHGLVRRTRAYRILHRLVRWPMIIPFIAAIAAPIINFRGIDDIVAGPGATPLFMLIALLMFAMRMFEPRMMWKTAGQAP